MTRAELKDEAYISLGITEEDVLCVGKFPPKIVPDDVWEVLARFPDAHARDLVAARSKVTAREASACPFEAFVAASNLTREEAVEVLRLATREPEVAKVSGVLLPPIEEDVRMISDAYNERVALEDVEPGPAQDWDEEDEDDE